MKEHSPAIVFFGTHISLPVLEQMKRAGLLPHLIVTQPDRPKGRRLIMTPPEVKVWAEENNIPVIQPETLKTTPKELLTQPNGKPWDLFVVVGYGKLIPEAILDLPVHKTLNVHPSLLPELRGASPIRSAILLDIKETGVTIILLDKEMDHGPIIAQARVLIEDWPPKATVLEDLLAKVGAELLVETIIPWINGDITPEEQDHDRATFSKKIQKEDGLIDLSNDAYQNYLTIQAFDGWPGTYFFVTKQDKKIRVKIQRASYKDGVLTIERVTPEGKKEMDYKDFKRGL